MTSIRQEFTKDYGLLVCDVMELRERNISAEM
jgi:hypothetical protein